MRVVAALTVALGLLGCTQGTTPDCSMVKCGPDVDGSFTPDATVEAATDAGDASQDASDAATDAPVDAPDAG